MKAITVSQPYASMIASGEKWVENRGRWNYVYRGPLAIHAGRGTQYLAGDDLARHPTGCVLSVVRLAAVMALESMRLVLPTVRLPGTTLTIGEILRHEHTEGPVCLVLVENRRLANPIPWRGAQGLWNVPAELERQIEEQLAPAEIGPIRLHEGQT